MTNADYHEMKLIEDHPTGAQQWACTKCERRFVMQISPTFNMIDLEIGNEQVSHTGGTGELRVGFSSNGKDEEQILSDELRAALDDILKGIDFGD